MTCPGPLSWDELVAYWARDLPATETDRIDEHLMSCLSCTARSARVAAVAGALRSFVPPVVTREVLRVLRARGSRIEENEFAPSDRKEVVFPPEVDLLIHHLSGLDLSNAERVRLSIRVEGTGDVLVEDPDVPFDPHEGVLIACQRHYASLPPDVVFELSAVEPSGIERTAAYTILHVWR